MCQPISWIEKDGHLLYLTSDDLQTRKGKKLFKEIGDLDDLAGHGAIREYFGLSENKGTNMEVNDLSSPKNFPDEIADAMRHGKFRNIFICPDMLTGSAQKKYRKVKQAAWAEYWKVKQAAEAEYQKVAQAAWAEYKKVQQAAFWDLWADPKNRIKAWR